MDWIESAIRIVRKEEETDLFTFNFCVKELNKRIKELTPLIIECEEKGIDLEVLCNKLYLEYKEINEALNA